MGAKESLNGRKDKARRKVKNGVKSHWGQCLTRPFPNGRRRSGFRLVPEKHKFSGTNQKAERRRTFGTGLVRHCPQGLFTPFFTFFVPYFSARLDFPSPPLSAPGSPRMTGIRNPESQTVLDPFIHVRESGFRNPGNFCQWNPGVWNPEYSCRNLESH